MHGRLLPKHLPLAHPLRNPIHYINIAKRKTVDCSDVMNGSTENEWTQMPAKKESRWINCTSLTERFIMTESALMSNLLPIFRYILRYAFCSQLKLSLQTMRWSTKLPVFKEKLFFKCFHLEHCPAKACTSACLQNTAPRACPDKRFLKCTVIHIWVCCGCKWQR